MNENPQSLDELKVQPSVEQEAIEQLVKIIKECGSYSVELDGYVVNPSTVACKVLNAGYRLSNDKEPSRSVQRRVAAQKGEPIPTFEDKLVEKCLLTPQEVGNLEWEIADLEMAFADEHPKEIKAIQKKLLKKAIPLIRDYYKNHEG